MKIAILSCNDFSVLGGGEKFIIDISTALNADIVSYGSPTDLHPQLVPHIKKFTFLGKTLPAEPLKQLYGIKLFRTLRSNSTFRPDQYDFYIVMDDIAIHYLRPDTPHLYYMFTPRRALYDMHHITLKEKQGAKKIIYSIATHLMKKFDRYTVSHIKNLATISHISRNRIFKSYHRHASVIYPPVHTSLFSYLPHENFFLSVSRIDKWKRIDLQIEAFRQLPDQNLTIVGTMYPSQYYILDNLPPNVTYLGVIPEDQLISLYSRCTAFITTAIDEDFGLTPLEAMASGKPVIATKEGGYLETVIDGHTGILIPPTVPALISAVTVVASSPFQYKPACIAQAKRFDYTSFKKTITNEINKITS